MLSLHLYGDTTMTGFHADYTARQRGLRFSTNEHGYESLECFVPMQLVESFEVYERQGLPHVVVSDNAAGVVWEGRLEDVSIVPGGVRLAAYGYQNALRDVTYTALWSRSGSAGWKPVPVENRSGNEPALYEMDNNNRLYISPRAGETFGNDTKYGELSYAAPHNGHRDIATFTASYSVTLPTNWQARLLTVTDGFASAVAEATVTGNGASQTGTWTLSLTDNDRLIFSLRNNTGGNSTITGNSGDWFGKLTSIRFKSTNSSSVLASEIVTALVSYINTLNADQLSTSTTLIETTTDALRDEVYEDELPADILDYLAGLTDWEWGVYDRRELFFRARGSAGRHWYVDALEINELTRSLEVVVNRVYTVYRDADGGRTLRTDVANDTDSQTKYGVVRRAPVASQTTDQTEAEAHRDNALEKTANQQALADIRFDRLYDDGGGAWPLYLARSGDTVTVRNLPPTLSTAIDNIHTFVISETEYDAETGELSISPERAAPTIARSLSGATNAAERPVAFRPPSGPPLIQK